MWLEAKQPRWIGKHRSRIWFRKTFAFEQVEKNFGVTSAQIGIGSALWRCVAKVSPSFDDLFGRTATDSELQASVADQVGGAGVLDHVVRIFITHVDDARSDFDLRRARADRGEEWKR